MERSRQAKAKTVRLAEIATIKEVIREPSKTEFNRRTADRFLNGTHSKDTADVDVIDETVRF
jgi:hypothetical protein